MFRRAVDRLTLARLPTALRPARVRRSIGHLPHRIKYGFSWRVASWARKRWAILCHPQATIRFGRGVYLGPGFGLEITGPGTFIVGDDVSFRRDCHIEISGNGRIEIGAGSYLTYGVLLACSTEMTIGERCGIGFYSSVYDGNHRYRDLSVAFLDQGYEFRPLTIEHDAQIHSLCTIINSIGTRAVIGANAVVSRPVPPYTLAVGAPARPIDYFGPPGEEPAELAAR